MFILSIILVYIILNNFINIIYIRFIFTINFISTLVSVYVFDLSDIVFIDIY